MLHMIGIHDLSLEVAEDILYVHSVYGANTALHNSAGLTPFDPGLAVDPATMQYTAPSRGSHQQSDDLFLKLMLF